MGGTIEEGGIASLVGACCIAFAALVTGLAGCTPQPTTLGPAVAPTGGAPTTAAAWTPIRVLRRRVLQPAVNMMEPLLMEVAGDEVSITFATGKQDGVTLAVDPATLAARTTDAVAYPERPKDEPPPYLATESAHVPLVGGGWVTVWTDAAASRVYAQRFDADGRTLGGMVLVSHEDADVLGPARAATVDGRCVVVAFFATHQSGYELVAAALDAAD